MSDHRVVYEISLIGNAEERLKKITHTAEQTRGRLAKVAQAFVGLNQASQFLGSVVEKMRAFTDANLLEVEATAKLAQVMRNTMEATDGQIAAVRALADAQEKLGVIEADVTVAGAQELGTYLTLSDSLQKLMPVMNDMLAQQYGLNASHEQAVQIASMMGKVMDGQVGALSRYGYKFDEAQEKILKFGSEEQRAATLAEVITSSVGGMNAALAATPYGAVRQVQNAFGEIEERVGGLLVKLQVALIPALEGVVAIADALIRVVDAGWPLWLGAAVAVGVAVAKVRNRLLETNLATAFAGHGFMGMAVVARQACRSIGTAIMSIPIVGWIAAGVTLVVGLFQQLWTKCEAFRGFLTGVWAVIKNTVGNLVGMVSGVVGKVHGAVTSVRTSILGSFEGVIGRVRGVLSKVGGWFGKVMQPVWDWFSRLWGHVKGILDRIVGFMGRIFDPIIQLWNKLTKGSIKSYREGAAAGRAAVRERKGDSMVPTLPAAPDLGGSGGGSVAAGGGGAMGGIDAVATGGSRSTSVTINLGSLVESIRFEGGLSESVDDLERRVAEALLRVLNMAQASVG